MTTMVSMLPDLDALDSEALKVLVIEQHAALTSHQAEIDTLKLLIRKLQRMQFGRRSEKLGQQIEQLEFQLEELEASESAPHPEPPIDPQSIMSIRRPVAGPAGRAPATGNRDTGSHRRVLPGLRRRTRRARRGRF